MQDTLHVNSPALRRVLLPSLRLAQETVDPETLRISIDLLVGKGVSRYEGWFCASSDLLPEARTPVRIAYGESADTYVETIGYYINEFEVEALDGSTFYSTHPFNGKRYLPEGWYEEGSMDSDDTLLFITDGVVQKWSYLPSVKF